MRILDRQTMEKVEMLAILNAIKINDLDYIKQMIKDNLKWLVGSLYDENDNEVFALHYAAKYGRLTIIKLLLEKRPDLLNLTDSNNHTPIRFAAAHGHLSVVVYLEKRWADLTIATAAPGYDCHRYLPIHWAMRRHHYEIVKYLLNHIPDIRILVDAQQNLVHIAAIMGQMDIMLILLSKARDLLNVKDANGQTPLLLAAAYHHAHLVKHFIFLGCVETGAHALELMTAEPYLVNIFLKYPEIMNLINNTRCNINQHSIDWYKPAGRRPSFFTRINRETGTSVQFKPVEELGKGSFGLVRLFRSVKGDKIAVKSLKINRAPISEEENHILIEALDREAQFNKRAYPDDDLSQIFNINHGITGNQAYINRYVMPYAQGERAFSLIPRIGSRTLLANITLTIAQEIQRVHERGIIHGDLNSANIIIKRCENNTLSIRLIDFGCASHVSESSATLWNKSCRGRWFAPELCNDGEKKIRPHTTQDIYAFGYFIDNILNEIPLSLRQETMKLFPSIQTFIIEAQNINPRKRPSLVSFCEQLSRELTPTLALQR